MKKIYIAIITIAVIGVLFATQVFASQNNNNNNNQNNNHHECEHNCHPSPTPTPTINPCDQEYVLSWKHEKNPCETPTPTPTIEPTVTPTPAPCTENCGNAPTFAGSSTNAPTCGDTKPGDIANITVVGTDTQDGKFLVEWSLPTGADKVHIRYEEYSQNDWPYSALNVPNTGNFEIGGLKNGVNYRVQVAGVNGCAVGNWSAVHDPKP